MRGKPDRAKRPAIGKRHEANLRHAVGNCQAAQADAAAKGADSDLLKATGQARMPEADASVKHAGNTNKAANGIIHPAPSGKNGHAAGDLDFPQARTVQERALSDPGQVLGKRRGPQAGAPQKRPSRRF